MEDCFDDDEPEAKLATLGQTSARREQRILRAAINRPDPSRAWLPGEDAVIVPIEPYDLIPGEAGEEQFPQFIPISPPVWNGTPQPHEMRMANDLVESAILIPIGEILPRKSEGETSSNHFLQREPERQRRHVVSSVLLLLLAVIALFVLAWMTRR